MKKFENLILDHIDSEISAPTYQDLMRKVRIIFESEMIYQGIKPSWTRVKDWLMGLCSTVTLPFYNFEILEWYAIQLKREIKESEQDRLVERYWDNAAKTLYSMLYHTKG